MLIPTALDGVQVSHWLPDYQPSLDLTVGAALRAAASEVPDRVALVDGSTTLDTRRRWTYAQLLEQAEIVSRNLRAELEVGDRLVLWGVNSPEWIITQLGAALAGVIIVPVDPAFKARELAYVLKDSGAAAVAHGDTFRGADLAVVIESVRDEAPALLKLFRLSGDELFDPSAASVPAPDLAPTDDVQIQYTSGTTGFPKGARMHHAGVLNSSMFCAARCGFGAGDVWINMMPTSHIAGSVTGVMGPLTQRGTQVILPGFDAASVLRLIEEEKGSLVLAVPTMLIAMLESPSFATADTSSLDCVLSGAATVPVSLVERVKSELGCHVSIVYGLTESPIIVQTHAADAAEDQSTTIGRPQSNVELAVMDPVTEEIVPVGEAGEIVVQCQQIMNGYLEMPEATATTRTSDGWFRTGDLAVMNDRGYLRITGRLKDMIVRGGTNVYPREIEELLFTHPSISDVSVVGIPDETLGEAVAAVVRFKEGVDAETPEALYEFALAHISFAKAPVLWADVDDFPLTPSGKIQKHVIKSQIRDGTIPVKDVRN